MRKAFAFLIGALLVGAAIASPTSAAERETVTVVDDRGIEVTFPRNPQRIVISSILPLPSVYCLYHGGVKNLVGIPSASMSAARHSYLAKVYPEILDLACDFSKGDVVNIEEVLKLNPDVVFYRANEVAEGEKYRAAGLPAVAFSTTKHGSDTIATFAGWLELLDKIFEGGQQTKGIVEHGQEVLRMMRARTANLSESDRPRTILFSGFTDGLLTTPGSSQFADFYINEGGGVNVAESFKGVKTVNLEQVYAWDPEVIFINNFCPYVPEDFYNNAIKGYDWSNVSAVKSKRVYKFPLGIYRWYPPAGDAPLSLLWAAKCLQPELFADVDITRTMKDYYSRFYGYELTDDDIEAIYNPPREAALR